MANENKMQYVILGLLSHEPMTGYELKKRMDTTMSLFWSGSFGSIYPTLQKLKSQGAVVAKEDDSDEGRSKITYEITNQGLEVLRDWLREPVLKDEIKYETLLKMFFGSEIGQQEIMKHVESFKGRTAAVLPGLEKSVEVLKGLDEEPAHEYYMLTAMFGVRMYEASLAWCRDVEEHFSAKEKGKKKG